MVTIGGQVHPYTGDAGPVVNISGKSHITVQNIHFLGTLGTGAKATAYTSGAFVEIQLSGGGKGYIEYLVSA